MTATFPTCSPNVAITGTAYMRGARGVVLIDKRPDPTSQYPADKHGYVSIYLFDRPFGKISHLHSHGYACDGTWDDYFRSVVS